MASPEQVIGMSELWTAPNAPLTEQGQLAYLLACIHQPPLQVGAVSLVRGSSDSSINPFLNSGEVEQSLWITEDRDIFTMGGSGKRQGVPCLNAKSLTNPARCARLQCRKDRQTIPQPLLWSWSRPVAALRFSCFRFLLSL